MCVGGGGGGDNGYAERAEQRALEDQARVKGAVSKLNTMFGIGDDPTASANKAARDRIYSGIETSTRDLNMTGLNDEYGKAGREVNFDAARRGLYGGSAYADQLGTLTDTRNKGLLKISDAALASANDARSADDRTRLGLARDITSGLDEGTALASAQNQLDSNAASARATASANAMSGFFDNILANIRQNQINAGVQSAQTKFGTMPSANASNGNIYGG